MGSEHYTAAQLMRQISEIARLSASTVDESERATRLLVAAHMGGDVESVLLDVAAVTDSAFRLRYAMIDAESKAANADAAFRSCFAAFTEMRARAEAAEQRAEAAERELAQVRAEGETAGRTAERVAVVAMLRGGAHSHRGFGVSLIACELERYADTIGAGAHVGAAGGAA